MVSPCAPEMWFSSARPTLRSSPDKSSAEETGCHSRGLSDFACKSTSAVGF